MSGWMIVADRLSDLPVPVAAYPCMTTRDYIMQPRASVSPFADFSPLSADSSAGSR